MKRENIKRILYDLITTIGLLALTTGLTLVLFFHVSDNPVNTAFLYLIAIIAIAHCTNGFIFGILVSICGVFYINCFFTYPYLSIDFSSPNYPANFICMLTLFIAAGITTSHIKQQTAVLSTREEQLLEAEKEKLRANLLRAVSHDLRTPLTGIIAASTSLEENWENYETTERLELICNIHNDADWLLNMVENLLSVTHIQTKGSKLNMRLEVLDEVVAESITRLKKRFPNTEIDVTVPMEIIMIPMDAMLIEQVLINFMENALTHSHSKQPIRLIVEDWSDAIHFRVIDYGIGLTEDHLKHIFDGTYPETISSDGHKGMGIGLSICRSIITAHRGTIKAKNHENGAEFLFTLPKEGEYE